MLVAVESSRSACCSSSSARSGISIAVRETWTSRAAGRNPDPGSVAANIPSSRQMGSMVSVTLWRARAMPLSASRAALAASGVGSRRIGPRGA